MDLEPHNGPEKETQRIGIFNLIVRANSRNKIVILCAIVPDHPKPVNVREFNLYFVIKIKIEANGKNFDKEDICPEIFPSDFSLDIIE